MKWRFGIIGGDRRQAELARMLAQDGHFVTTYGLDSGENMLKGRLEQALSADGRHFCRFRFAPNRE